MVYLVLSLDQRLSIWTSLIVPGLLLVYLFQANWTAVEIICSWLLFTRPLMLIVMFWGRESFVKLIHLPILLLAQWSGSAIKVWTQKRQIKTSTSRFLLVSQVFSFVILLLCLLQILAPLRDLPELWSYNLVVAQPTAIQTVEAIDRVIVPNDERDDSVALQNLTSTARSLRFYPQG